MPTYRELQAKLAKIQESNDKKDCPSCGGSGSVEGHDGGERHCKKCNGEGWIWESTKEIVARKAKLKEHRKIK